MKIVFLFISALICIGISGCKKDVSRSFRPEKFLPKILKNEDITQGKVLVLFLAEGMCSECINQEFINLKEQKKLLDHLIVVGIFSHKRIFNSCVNSLKPNMKVFYDVKLLAANESLPSNPVYLIYDRKQNRVSDIFYPQACRIAQTLEYFKNIKSAIGVSGD